MREFTSFGDFAGFLGALSVIVEADRRGLDKATKLIQKTAKAKIGDYQEQAGPFAPWAPLAASTIAEKQSLGYTGQVSEDDPLLRTEEMRESIERTFGAKEGYVGSNSDIMVYQELGTRHIPPRSVLGGAAAEKGKEVSEIIGEQTYLTLIGGGVFQGALPIYEGKP